MLVPSLPWKLRLASGVCWLLLVAVMSSGLDRAHSQEIGDAANEVLSPESPATDGLDPAAAMPTEDNGRLNLLELLLKGGWLMVPIGLMSVAVVMLVFERSIGAATPPGDSWRFGREIGRVGCGARRDGSASRLPVVSAIPVVRGRCDPSHVAQDRAPAVGSRARRG